MTENDYEKFIVVLRDGGSLIVHPDTWAELKRAAPMSDVVDALRLAASTRVIPSEFLEPGQMMAFKPKRFELPDFTKWCSEPIGDPAARSEEPK